MSTRPPDPTPPAPAAEELPPPPRPDIPPAAPPLSTEALILLIIGTIAALYLGRDVFIPLALAILLSFALGPLVTRLYRLGLGRVPAVILVMALVTLLVAGFAGLVASQLVHLAQGLPRYEANLRAKAQALAEAAPGGGLIDRTADLLRDVGEEIEKITEGKVDTTPEGAGPAAPPAEEPRQPIPVEIHQPPPPPLEALTALVGPLLKPIATAGIVLVFIIFVLLQREDLRDRLIRLFGLGDVNRTTEAVTDAAKRIGRYLLMQLVINVTYGIPVGVGLFLIGVPNALLWGVLATVLRFIPYLGPFLGALFPIALSIAVDPGWTTMLLTVALFVTLELLSNNIMEPWLYGSSTGLSPLAIIVAAVFWTTLWGPIGLLLSTPLTVCLVVLGRHVPQLHFFEVLLGDTPVLTPEIKFYQRLLAGDPYDAEDLATDLLEELTLGELFDRVILPALVLAEQDRLRGALDRVRARAFSEAVIGIVDHLAETADGDSEAGQEKPAPSLKVLCIGSRNGLDLAAAVMLAHLLRTKGVEAQVTGEEGGLPTGTKLAGFDAVCLSVIDPRALRQARRLVLRLRGRRAEAANPRLHLGLWGLPPGEVENAKMATGADRVAETLGQAVEAILPPPVEAADRPPAMVSASP